MKLGAFVFYPVGVVELSVSVGLSQILIYNWNTRLRLLPGQYEECLGGVETLKEVDCSERDGMLWISPQLPAAEALLPLTSVSRGGEEKKVIVQNEMRMVLDGL